MSCSTTQLHDALHWTDLSPFWQCLAEYEESEEDIDITEGAGPPRGRRRRGRAPRRRRNRWEHGSVQADSPGHVLNAMLCMTATVKCILRLCCACREMMLGLPHCQQEALPAAATRLFKQAVTAFCQCCLSNCPCGTR